MKLITYYIAITFPFVLLVLMMQNGMKTFASSGLLFYALIYRPIIDGQRLMNINKLEKSQFIRVFNPIFMMFKRRENYRAIYFGK
ncbi:hypothetical protein [Aureivirga sp. CE67]|uniref:hypothetical protein n=1 Tax=Aureivirga sp. CE67 TaxID=1788983 RepID=UPI0018C9482E|nr:hypothetical protein [Aureivirga sp. CE67]